MIEWFYCIAEGIMLVYGVLKLHFRFKKEVKENERYFQNTIQWESKLGKIVLISLGIIFLAHVFTIVALYTQFVKIINNDSLMVLIGYLLFDIACFWAIGVTVNWKIEVKDEYFIYTNLFGIKRKLYYEGIYSRAYKGVYRYFKNGRKLPLFTISYLIPNCDRLEIKLREHNMKKQKK